MPLHGTIKRTKPRVTVLRGYNPNEPQTLTQSHPVKSGVTIKSGQAISLEWVAGNSRYEWILGGPADEADATMIYVALQDWDLSQTGGLGSFGYDPDAVEAGKLTGLSCAGQFELETAYYKSDDTYTLGAPITYDGTTTLGNFKVATADTDLIIGRISRTSGQSSPIDLTGKNSEATTLTVITFTTGVEGRMASS